MDGDEHPFAGTILLVDDEKDLRELLFSSLQLDGHAVLQADSPAQAMQRFGHQLDEIDIVVTDIVMPGKSGDEFALELLRLRPSLKIIFISGNIAADYDSKVPLVHGENYLRKPFSLGELENMIQRFGKGLMAQNSN
ncbi:MAG TPA: response regulator [Verrucomicrobiae bacterium]|jgi:two-component system cell cycle sensor histidine kinase/response regulator CckA|nr:response regulator [Verrucomicrobiae bacterium]